jgi:sulfoxide reductase heme-binding subunit YedZ
VSAYTDPSQHLFWIASRALGVAALILVAVSVGLGLAMASRLTRDPGAAARVKTLHEATALVSLMAIAGHGLALLGDSYLKPGIVGISVPFVISHAQVWTGIGVIGGWVAAILGLSFYVRRWIGPKLWRRMHRWTLGVYVLGVAHTLGSGTDAGTLWLLAIVGATLVPIVFLTGMRVIPRKPNGPKPRPARPRPAGRRSARIPRDASGRPRPVAERI